MDNLETNNTIQFWQKYRSKAIKEYTKQQDRWQRVSINLWKNLIIVQATILGFSIALYSIQEMKPLFITLKISWSLMLFSIFVGFLLLREYNDISIHNASENFKLRYNMGDIEEKKNKGLISPEEYNKLVFTAIFLHSPLPQKEPIYKLTEKAKRTLEEYKNKLSSAEFLEHDKEATFNKPLNLWFANNLFKIETLFYLLSFLALLFLLITVLIA